MRNGDARAPWEFSGDLVDKDGKLERPYDADRWTVPTEIELDGDRLIWRPPSSFGGGGAYRRRGPEPGILASFTHLVDAPPARYLTYARTWGVLELCEHGIPATHNPVPAPVPGHATRLSAACHPTGSEPLDAWRRYARQARALLNIAADLHAARVGRAEDWVAVFEHYAPHAPRWQQSSDMDRVMLEVVVREWVGLSNVRPAVRWHGDRPRLTLGSGSLFGALTVQLMLAIGRSDGIAHCSACGQPYIPAKRPSATLNHYCPDCGRAAAVRLASRRYQERKRAAA